MLKGLEKLEIEYGLRMQEKINRNSKGKKSPKLKILIHTHACMSAHIYSFMYINTRTLHLRARGLKVQEAETTKCNTAHQLAL